MTKAPEPGEVNPEDVSEQREDNKIVSDRADRLLRMKLRQRADCIGHARLHVDETFAAGHGMSRSAFGGPRFEEAGIALSHFREPKAVAVTNRHLDVPG